MSWIDAFSSEFAATLRRGIEESAGDNRRVAAFDADGTLWDRDLGEAFMRWLIARRKLLNVDYGIDLYEDYERRVDEDRTAAYASAVQMMGGLSIDDVKAWSAALSYAWPNYRPRMNALVAGLKEEGFECWIVSASNHWTIGEAARFAGFAPDMVYGIRTEVDNGVITDRLVHPVTCNQGKVDTILQLIGVTPVFAFGDSLGDYEMLCHAKYGMGVEQFGASKASFRKAAKEQGWPVEVF